MEGREAAAFDVGQAPLSSRLKRDGDEVAMELKRERERLQTRSRK